MAGIRVHAHEESHTSKCILLDMESVCKHKEYLERRVLFMSHGEC